MSRFIEERDEIETCEITVVRDHAFGDDRMRCRLGDVVYRFQAVRDNRDDLRRARILQRASKGLPKDLPGCGIFRS